MFEEALDAGDKLLIVHVGVLDFLLLAFLLELRNPRVNHLTGGHSQGEANPACTSTFEGQKPYFIM